MLGGVAAARADRTGPARPTRYGRAARATSIGTANNHSPIWPRGTAQTDLTGPHESLAGPRDRIGDRLPPVHLTGNGCSGEDRGG